MYSKNLWTVNLVQKLYFGHILLQRLHWSALSFKLDNYSNLTHSYYSKDNFITVISKTNQYLSIK
jgi:hypothetical protein